MFSLILIACFLASTLVVLLNVKERYTSKTDDQKLSLKEMFSLIKQNDQLTTLLGMPLSYNLAINVIQSFAIYYFTYVVGDKDMLVIYFGLAATVKLVALVFFSRLAKIFSRKMLWLGSTVCPIIGCLFLIVIAMYAPQSKILISISGIFLSIGTALFWALIVIMIADSVDYGEFKHGVRCESVAFSVQTLVVKA